MNQCSKTVAVPASLCGSDLNAQQKNMLNCAPELLIGTSNAAKTFSTSGQTLPFGIQLLLGTTASSLAHAKHGEE